VPLTPNNNNNKKTHETYESTPQRATRELHYSEETKLRFFLQPE
jgi:hypothetical protein